MTYQFVADTYILRDLKKEKNTRPPNVGKIILALAKSMLFEAGITSTNPLSVASSRARELSSQGNMSMALLMYVLLSTDKAYSQYTWSIYNNNGYPIVRGEKKEKGLTKYMLSTSMSHKLDKIDDSMPICSAVDAIDLQQELYLSNHPELSVRPITSIGRAEDILGELTPYQQHILNTMFSPGADIDSCLQLLRVDSEDASIIKADATSLRLLQIYEMVFKSFPNPTCRVYPPVPKREFKSDTDFIFQ